MRFGEYEVDSVDAGRFRLDGGAMFGVVPRVLWEKTNPPDEKNRILMALRCFLIRGNGKTILIDTGIGTHWNEKERAMYAIDHSQRTLESELARLGVDAAQITDVVITHLHFDHVGGATERREGQPPRLAFANARYWIHRLNFTHSCCPSVKDRASFVEETLRPLSESPQVRRAGAEVEIAPGVRTWVTHGHTPGQQLVVIYAGDQALFFGGDTIPTSSHVPLPYVMAYDLQPMVTIEEKKAILDRIAGGRGILAFVHDPDRAACRVNFSNGKYSRGEDVTI